MKETNIQLELHHKEVSDEELVKSFVEYRDQGALNEIRKRHGNNMYRLALRITRNPSDAEDVLQEVFINLITKLYTFYGKSKFSTWLYRVTANVSYIHYRADKKYRNVVSLEEYVSYDDDGTLKGFELEDQSYRPDEVLLGREAMEIIEKALNELPVHHRVVVYLRDLQGLTNHEVAEVLGLSIRCAATRVHRARTILRDKLSDYFCE